MKIVSPTFPVKCDVIYWKPHGRIKGYIRFSDYSHVLRSSVVDHKGHTIQLVIIAIQSSLYWYENSFTYISCKMRCYILETPWTYQRVYKTGVGANKNIEMKWVQQFSNELNDPHGRPHCIWAHINNHWSVNYDIHVYDTNFLEAILKIKKM